MPYIFVILGTLLSAAALKIIFDINRIKYNVSISNIVESGFPRKAWLSRSAFFDAFLWLLTKLLAPLLGLLQLSLIAIGTAHVTHLAIMKFDPAFEKLHANFAWSAGIIALIFITREFAEFLLHYASHKNPVLWEIHKVHHSAEHLIPLTARRNHPFYPVFSSALSAALSGPMIGIFGAVFDISVLEFAIYAGVLTKLVSIISLDTLRHSHFHVNFGWADCLFISPHMHHIHHSSIQAHWDKNFGTNLSIFDWVFGTAYVPVRGEVIKYGLNNENETKEMQSFYGVLIRPLKNIHRILTPRSRTILQNGPVVIPKS